MSLLDVIFPAVDAPPEQAVFPLRKGVWYRSRRGQYVKVADADTTGRAIAQCDYYDDMKGHRQDWWMVVIADGRLEGCNENIHDIIGLAEAAPPAPVPATDALLPLQAGVWYRDREGRFAIHLPEWGDYGLHPKFRYFTTPNYKQTMVDYWGVSMETGNVVAMSEKPSFTIVARHSASQPEPSVSAAAAPPAASGLMAELAKLNQAAIAQAVDTAIAARLAGHKHDILQTTLQVLEEPIGVLIQREAAKHVVAKTLEVRDRAEVRVIQSPHPKLAEAVEISSAINNVWLCGPAGSGKTTLAHQLAQALGRDFAFVSCTAGMSESKLLGRMNVSGAYLPAEFVRIYEEGGVFLWDEFDAADPNVVLCANSAMANGHLSVPDRIAKPVAVRHPDTILVVATNTWGRGSSSEYSARETLDAATRDRFVMSKIEVDYAPHIEFQYLGSYDHQTAKPWACPHTSKTLQSIFVGIRANIAKHHLRRILSTRAFAQAAALRGIGWDDAKIVERYFVDWPEQERTKALEGVC